MAENENDDRSKACRARAASVETLGLLLIALIVALVLLWRWVGDIAWSAR